MKIWTMTALLAATSAQAVTITHLAGTTELKTTPKRIVALEYNYQDALLKLGIKPVGVADHGAGPLPHLAKGLKGVPSVGLLAEPNLEKIMALKPDLILADAERHKAIFEQLNRIAPTIMFNTYYGTYKDQLEQFSVVAKIVGKEPLAKTALVDNQRIFQKAKILTHPETFVTGVMTPTDFWVHTDKSFVGSMLQDLGLKTPVHNNENTQYKITLENLVAYNPDALVIMINPGDEALWKDWQKNPLYQSLKAVKNKKVYTFSRELWAKGRGIQGINLILQQATTSGLLTGKTQK